MSKIEWGGFCNWVSENVASAVNDFEFIDKKRGPIPPNLICTHLTIQASCIYIG